MWPQEAHWPRRSRLSACSYMSKQRYPLATSLIGVTPLSSTSIQVWQGWPHPIPPSYRPDCSVLPQERTRDQRPEYHRKGSGTRPGDTPVERQIPMTVIDLPLVGHRTRAVIKEIHNRTRMVTLSECVAAGGSCVFTKFICSHQYLSSYLVPYRLLKDKINLFSEMEMYGHK